MQWPVPQRGIIEIASTIVLKNEATRKKDETTKGGVLKLWRNPQRGIIGLAGTGVALQAMSAAFLEREERPSGHLFFHFNSTFSFYFYWNYFGINTYQIWASCTVCLASMRDKRSRMERHLSRRSGPVGNCVEIIRNDLVCRVRGESIMTGACSILMRSMLNATGHVCYLNDVQMVWNL